jgi:hypothetical protein
LLQLAIVSNDTDLRIHTAQAKEKEKAKRRTPQAATGGKSRALESHLPEWTDVQEFKSRLLPTFIEFYGAAEDPWDLSNHLAIAEEVVKKCCPNIKGYHPQRGDALAHEVRFRSFKSF